MRGSFFQIGFFLAGILLFAGETVARPYTIGPDLSYDLYEDAGGRMALEDFLALPASELRRESRFLSQGYTDSAFWMRFTVPAALFSDGPLWLQLAPNYLDELTLYSRPLGADAPWRRREAGDVRGPPDDDFDYRFPVFAFAPPAPSSVGYDIVLRMRSTSAVLLLPRFWRPAELLGHAARETSFWSFYFGLAAFSTALAVLLAFQMRNRMLWSISAFSVLYVLVANVQGYVNWLVGDIFPSLQHYMTSVAVLLTYIALLWMCTEVLGIRQRSLRIYKALIGCVPLSLLLLLSIPLNFYSLSKYILILLCVAIAILSLCTVLRPPGKGERRLPDIAIGMLPILFVLSGALQELNLAGIIPFALLTHEQWQYSIMFMILLILGMTAHRVRMEQREHAEKQQLARELRVEREASFNQRQFIAMVSHEFRTPLAVISAAVQNLRMQTASEPEITQRHERIERAANRLMQLTDNCLADARLTAETLYIDTKPMDLMAEVRAAAGMVELSDRHRLRLTIGGQPAADESVTIQADGALLRIALSNVLDNAMKYSARGDIHVDVARQDEMVVISIRDRGHGVPKDQAEHIFERYRRADGGSYPRGAGLGLFVARQIARAHRGDLALAANTPQGCCFEFRLPAFSATTIVET